MMYFNCVAPSPRPIHYNLTPLDTSTYHYGSIIKDCRRCRGRDTTAHNTSEKGREGEGGRGMERGTEGGRGRETEGRREVGREGGRE